MTCWSRSGSSRSPSPVDPLTSANSTVTSLRSWPASCPAGAGSGTGAPHAGQNRAPSGSAAPHRAQETPSGVPQDAQNLAPSAFWVPQREHVAIDGECIGVGGWSGSVPARVRSAFVPRPRSARMKTESGPSSGMPPQYDAAATEPRWYREWVERGLFHAEPNARREPYSIVLPPPNVTGALHIGHALQQTFQD